MAIKKCYAIFVNDRNIVTAGPSGYEFNKKEGITFLFYSETEAIHAAHKLAAKNPEVPVIVLEAKNLIQAKRPETSAKLWKENGELIPVEHTLKPEGVARELQEDIEIPLNPAQVGEDAVARMVAGVQVQANWAEIGLQNAVPAPRRR